MIAASGRYFDGETAEPANVLVSIGGRTLVLAGYDGSVKAHWPLINLRAVNTKGDGVYQLVPHAGSDERLVVTEPALIEALRAHCPKLYARKTDRKGLKRAGFYTLLAVAAVVTLVTVIIPALAGQLAAIIPPEREQRLGDAVVAQIQDLLAFSEGDVSGFCRASDGRAALGRMTGRLEAAVAETGLEMPFPLRVDVLDHGLVNAVAAPGGRILIFRGLIDEAENPEEVAGVLAHEIGHVIHRDPTTGALRAAGSAGILGLLLGDVFGATIVIAATEAVMNASYTREAETRADDTALALLAATALPSTPFAGFFRRMAETNGEMPGVLKYIASHPALGERADRAAGADSIGAGIYRPALADRDWVALREICTAGGG